MKGARPVEQPHALSASGEGKQVDDVVLLLGAELLQSADMQTLGLFRDSPAYTFPAKSAAQDRRLAADGCGKR